ncbi:hypothetical protein TRIUR3_13241 [Triticum urartu]|uniref:Aminotransferase-like plant mobile domain-containing protein n=1 Tax=Triticum urartu TaxID=4572 RepID=M7ZJ95_TRIUA|nr:hypothetical protein TRIUR3_13241 [Triticum urartu]
MPQLDKALITALVERWRPETHSFHLASGEMTVTLQDVAMLFALPIDGRPVCSSTDHDYGQMVLDCLGHDPRGQSMPGKSFLHYKWLKKHFYELPEGADDHTVQRHVRAYILSLLCGVLFPDGTGRMSLIYLPLIADLSLVGTYSWGSAALAFLYRALCSAASSHNMKNIGGSLLLLQLWSWEHSHVGRPLARSSSVAETDIPQDLPPIGFRWVGARAQSENATRCLKQYRDELNLQRADQLKWEPYMLIESSSLPPLCTKDADLWITQAPLINFPIVEMYLPERVMRQFGLRQCIPPPFRPTLQTLHRISRRGRERENWEETHHEYIQEWEARRQRIFRETEQFDLSSYDEYLQWYSGATRRYLVPSTDIIIRFELKLVQVDKLHGMMKKAKTAMASTADTATQALVFEFLHGFEDVLSDLGEIKERGGPEAPPFDSVTGSHCGSAAPHHESLLLLEAEQNIICDNQEGEYLEDEDLHTVEQATLGFEPMGGENHRVDSLLLDVHENCDSASLAIENCEAEDFDIPQHTEDVDQAGHAAEMEHGVEVVEPMSTCEENNGFDVAPSPPQESADVKLEGDDVATAEHEDAEEENDSDCNGAPSSHP